MAITSYRKPKSPSRFKLGEKLKDVKEEIKILGAGISGLTAGIILAKNNYPVKIFEKRSRVGSFIKKDIHSLRNYSYDYDVIEKYKELGIKISNFYPIFKEFRFSPSLKYIEIYSKNKPLFYNVIRGYADERSLDIDLFNQAKKYGAEFIFNSNIDPDKKSDIDIIATGAVYRKGLVYGQHYKNISIEPNALYFFLQNVHSSYAYSYIVPFSENEASLAIVSPRQENKEYIKKEFNKLLKENNVVKKVIKNANLENDFFGYASFKIPETAIKHKKLYVGEAAGFLDATTGYGIHFAVLSGYLAAQSIIKNKNYDELWKNSFEEELKKRIIRRNLMKKLGVKGQKMMIENLVKKYGNRISIEDYNKIYDKIPKINKII